MPKGVYQRKSKARKKQTNGDGEHTSFPLALIPAKPTRSMRLVSSRQTHREERMLLALALVQAVRDIVNG